MTRFDAKDGAPPQTTTAAEEFVVRDRHGEIVKIRYSDAARFLIRQHGARRIGGALAVLTHPLGDPECDGLYDIDEESMNAVMIGYAPNLATGAYGQVREHACALTSPAQHPERSFQPDKYAFATKDGTVVRVDLKAVRSGRAAIDVVPRKDVPKLNLVRSLTIDVVYDPDARSPELEANLLAYAGGNTQRLRRLCEAMSTTLILEGDKKGLIVLYGKSGSGKSTLLKLLQGFLGVRASHSSPLNTLDNGNFGLAPLIGKRLYCDEELTRGKVTDGALSKLDTFTTGGHLAAERKGRDERVDVGGFTCAIATNHALNLESPLRDEDAKALRRRTVMIVFRRRIPEEERESAYENAFLTEHEKSALLNILLEALARFLAQGGYTPVPEDDALADEWYGIITPTRSFLTATGELGRPGDASPREERLDLGDGLCDVATYPLALWDDAVAAHRGDPLKAALPARFDDEYSVLYARYLAWEHGRGRDAVGRRMFSQQLRRLGYHTMTVRTGLGVADGSRTAKVVVPETVKCMVDLDAYVRSLRTDASAHVGPVLTE